MNLPNTLTLLRFLLAVAVFWILARAPFSWWGGASLLFVFACVTDYFDGYLARKCRTITSFGRIADPLADKFLVIGVLIFFWERIEEENMTCALNALSLFLILMREFFVSGLRALSESRGQALPALTLGKVKAVWQYFCAGLLFFFVFLKKEGVGGAWVDWLLDEGSFFLVWSTVILTWISVIPYLKQTAPLFSLEKDSQIRD